MESLITLISMAIEALIWLYICFYISCFTHFVSTTSSIIEINQNAFNSLWHLISKNHYIKEWSLNGHYLQRSSSYRPKKPKSWNSEMDLRDWKFYIHNCFHVCLFICMLVTNTRRGWAQNDTFCRHIISKGVWGFVLPLFLLR